MGRASCVLRGQEGFGFKVGAGKVLTRRRGERGASQAKETRIRSQAGSLRGECPATAASHFSPSPLRALHVSA